MKRYECNWCNNEPCVFESSTPDNLKPGLCPIIEPDGGTFNGVNWQAAPLAGESAEKSDNTGAIKQLDNLSATILMAGLHEDWAEKINNIMENLEPIEKLNTNVRRMLKGAEEACIAATNLLNRYRKDTRPSPPQAEGEAKFTTLLHPHPELEYEYGVSETNHRIVDEQDVQTVLTELRKILALIRLD